MYILSKAYDCIHSYTSEIYNYATYIKVQQKEIFKELKVRIKII